jgi:hypothetical protein
MPLDQIPKKTLHLARSLHRPSLSAKTEPHDGSPQVTEWSGRVIDPSCDLSWALRGFQTQVPIRPRNSARVVFKAEPKGQPLQSWWCFPHSQTQQLLGGLFDASFLSRPAVVHQEGRWSDSSRVCCHALTHHCGLHCLDYHPREKRQPSFQFRWLQHQGLMITPAERHHRGFKYDFPTLGKKHPRSFLGRLRRPRSPTQPLLTSASSKLATLFSNPESHGSVDQICD